MRAVPLRLVSEGAPGAQDGSALDEAFRQFAPRVATAALRILGRQDDADDLVQDVFIKARGWLPRLRDPSAVQAWLMRVTVRLGG